MTSKFGQFEPYAPAPWEATHTLDAQIARAREEMGEAKWAELCAEFDVEPARVLKGSGQ